MSTLFCFIYFEMVNNPYLCFLHIKSAKPERNLNETNNDCRNLFTLHFT